LTFWDYAVTKNYSGVYLVLIRDSHPNTIETVTTLYHPSIYIQTKHTIIVRFWYRLEGSTLQVMGPNVYKGEWSIVGGTGKLTMARGVIYKEELCVVDGMARIGLEIHAFYIRKKNFALDN
jgi:hypothetical protein